MSAPGIFGLIIREPTITTMTPSDTASVVMLVSPMFSSVPMNLLTVPPVPLGTPSMPATCPIATWMPTPVRKPISTLRERKSARNPSRISRATISSTPVKIASAPAYATYCGDAIGAMPASPAARIAAVAESAPTTRCRDEPSSANTAIGIRIVYRPVITGMPAIVV